MLEPIVAIGLVILVAIAVILDVINPGPTPPDADSLTLSDERCQALRIKQAQAAKRMKKLGIRSLLEGRPAWQRINPMHVADEPKKVVQMKRSAK